MSFEDIYKQFTKPTKENFPIADCTRQNSKEHTVYDSDVPYLCLMIDKRFDYFWQLIILYPYICKESEEVTTFGWCDINGNPFCNIENSVQLWDEFVIGFKKYEECSYKDMWKDFLQKIEDQYED